jgi:hypothetical protein
MTKRTQPSQPSSHAKFIRRPPGWQRLCAVTRGQAILFQIRTNSLRKNRLVRDQETMSAQFRITAVNLAQPQKRILRRIDARPDASPLLAERGAGKGPRPINDLCAGQAGCALQETAFGCHAKGSGEDVRIQSETSGISRRNEATRQLRCSSHGR